MKNKYYEELCNIVNNQPVFTGDTLSHQSANTINKRGLIKRDDQGNWIPTIYGYTVYVILTFFQDLASIFYR